MSSKENIYMWDKSLLYPSLFIFNKTYTIHDSALDFALSISDYSKSIAYDDLLEMVKDGIIVPIILYTDRDELEITHELFLTNNRKRAEHLEAKQYFQHNIMAQGVWKRIREYPKKQREKTAEILDRSKPFTRKYRFIDYFEDSPRPTLKITKQFKVAEKAGRKLYKDVRKYWDKGELFTRFKDEIELDLVTEAISSITISNVFNCSVIEDEKHLRVYDELLSKFEKEVYELRKIRTSVSESQTLRSFMEVLKRSEFRIPSNLDYTRMKRFRQDSAHRNLNNWLAKIYNSVQKEEEPPPLPVSVALEFNELSKNLTEEISRRSLISTIAISGFASFITTMYPIAASVVAASLASYFPFTYFFRRLYKKVNKNNFVLYFMDWRKPAIRLK